MAPNSTFAAAGRQPSESQNEVARGTPFVDEPILYPRLARSDYGWLGNESCTADLIGLWRVVESPGRQGLRGPSSNRFQNGCSASFLVEGGFDSHAPPPPDFELEISTRVLV
jgi:hypothetical protein